jgi:hypothetical protein
MTLQPLDCEKRTLHSIPSPQVRLRQTCTLPSPPFADRLHLPSQVLPTSFLSPHHRIRRVGVNHKVGRARRRRPLEARSRTDSGQSSTSRPVPLPSAYGHLSPIDSARTRRRRTKGPTASPPTLPTSLLPSSPPLLSPQLSSSRKGSSRARLAPPSSPTEIPSSTSRNRNSRRRPSQVGSPRPSSRTSASPQRPLPSPSSSESPRSTRTKSRSSHLARRTLTSIATTDYATRPPRELTRVPRRPRPQDRASEGELRRCGWRERERLRDGRC